MPDNTVDMIKTRGYRNRRFKEGSIDVALLDDAFNLFFEKMYNYISIFVQKEAVVMDECRDIKLVTLLRICDCECLAVD